MAVRYCYRGNHCCSRSSMEGTVDSSVFASLATLCLGYVFGRNVAGATNGNGAK